jgi:hypothetical protein
MQRKRGWRGPRGGARCGGAGGAQMVKWTVAPICAEGDARRASRRRTWAANMAVSSGSLAGAMGVDGRMHEGARWAAGLQAAALGEGGPRSRRARGAPLA